MPYLQIAQEAARAAGRVLQEWSEKFTVSEKGPAELVTEADVAAQRVIHQLIVEKFPDHGFLGEEGLSKPGTSGYRWVIDPLDGTSNYVHRFPYYAVSIGLELNRELILGVIFDPNRDELFYATKGGGAFANGKPIKPSKAPSVSQALLVASFPPAANSDNPSVRRFLKILPMAQAVQRTGSAAMNLAYLAAGRMDGFWSMSLKPWDMAAGALILTEAGGKVTRTDGRPLDIEFPDILATNGTGLHAELVGLLTA